MNEEFISFFRDSGILDECINLYVSKFIENDIQISEIHLLSESQFEKMGVTKIGHQNRILEHAKRKNLEQNIQATAGASTSSEVTKADTSLLVYLHSINKNDDDDDTRPPRRKNYVKWTNESKNVGEMFQEHLAWINDFFAEYYLEIDGNELLCKDILEIIINGSQKKPSDVIEFSASKIQFVEYDYPLSKPIFVSNASIEKTRTSVTSQVKRLGSQHLYLADGMLDSSSSASELDRGEPVLKKLKTCQKKKYMNLDGMLSEHQENKTNWDGKTTYTDILFFVSGLDMCESLATFLGLIFVEGLIQEADINANCDEVLQLRTASEDAKLYGLIQAYMNAKLMFGYNSICITTNRNVFKFVHGNAKAIILGKLECHKFSDIRTYSNFEIIIPDKNFSTYVSAISTIGSRVLNVKADIDTIFFSKKDVKYFNVKLPLFCIIPFYVLKFFSQMVLNKQGDHTFTSLTLK